MWSDDETTIFEMRGEVGRFITEREWGRYHAPVNAASAIAVEAGELLELFQWRRSGDPVPEDVVRQAGEELADVLHFTFCLMNAIDMEHPFDGSTMSHLLRDERAVAASPKEAAEEVLIGATFVLMASRASSLTREIAEAVDEGGPEAAIVASVDYLLKAIASCGSVMGLDLSRELELKNRLNEERYPVGAMPDVGY